MGFALLSRHFEKSHVPVALCEQRLATRSSAGRRNQDFANQPEELD